MADAEPFPDCCGLIVLNGFRGGHPGADIDSCIKPTALNKFLVKHEQDEYGKRAGLIAVLSEPQQDQIGHVFLERKWECLLDGVMNPRSGQLIYMYFRNLNPTKAREKRIFGNV